MVDDLVGAMSVDHSFVAKPPTKKDSLVLHVKAGMTVVVSEGEVWWMADVAYKEGVARDPKVPSMIQIACVDTGLIPLV